jgi:hypothetical protein
MGKNGWNTGLTMGDGSNAGRNTGLTTNGIVAGRNIGCTTNGTIANGTIADRNIGLITGTANPATTTVVGTIATGKTGATMTRGGAGTTATGTTAGTATCWPTTSMRVATNSLPLATSHAVAGAPTYCCKVQNGTLVEFTSTAV